MPTQLQPGAEAAGSHVGLPGAFHKPRGSPHGPLEPRRARPAQQPGLHVQPLPPDHALAKKRARMMKRKQIVLPSLEYVSMLLEQELQCLPQQQQCRKHQQRRQQQPPLQPADQQLQLLPEHAQQPAQRHWEDLQDGRLQKRHKAQPQTQQQQQQHHEDDPGPHAHDAPATGLLLQLPRNRSDLSNNRVEASPGRDRSLNDQQEQQQQPASDPGEQVVQQQQQQQLRQPDPSLLQRQQPDRALLQRLERRQPDQVRLQQLQQQPQQADQPPQAALPLPPPKAAQQEEPLLPPPLPDVRGRALLSKLPLAIQLRQQFFTQRLMSCQRSLDHKLLQGQMMLHQLLQDQQLQNELISELLHICNKFEKHEQKLKTKLQQQLLFSQQLQQQLQQQQAAAPSKAAPAATAAAAVGAAVAPDSAAAVDGAAATPGGSSQLSAMADSGPAAAAGAGSTLDRRAPGAATTSGGVAAATKAAQLAALAEEKAMLDGCFSRMTDLVRSTLGRDCRWAALATAQKQRLLEQLEQRVMSRLDGPLGLLEQLFAETSGTSDGAGASARGSGGGGGGSGSSSRGGRGVRTPVEQPLMPLQRLFDAHHQELQTQPPAQKAAGHPQQRPPPMVPCTMLGSGAVAAAAAAAPPPAPVLRSGGSGTGLAGSAEAPGAPLRSASPAAPPPAAAAAAAVPAAGAGAAADEPAAADDFLSVGEDGVGFAGAAGRRGVAVGAGGCSPGGFPVGAAEGVDDGAAAVEELDEMLQGIFGSCLMPGSGCYSLLQQHELPPGLELPAASSSGYGGGTRGLHSAIEYLKLSMNQTSCGTPMSGQGQRQPRWLGGAEQHGSKRGGAAAGEDDLVGGALLTTAEAAKRLRLSSPEVPDTGGALTTLSDLLTFS